VGFTIHQQQNTCVLLNASLLDGDLPAFVNWLVFKDGGSIFVLCTSHFNYLFMPASDATASNANTTVFWTPCTLQGLTAGEYHLKNFGGGGPEYAAAIQTYVYTPKCVVNSFHR
jgi:hypothetical protein